METGWLRRELTDVLSGEQKIQEANEQRWAEAAQAVFRGRSSRAA